MGTPSRTDAADPPRTSASGPRPDHVDHLLAQWQRERPDLDTTLLAISTRLVRLSRYLDRTIADHLAPFGLHEGEVNVLAALRRSGPPYVLTPTELYRSLLVSSGAMTNRLDRLEEAGLLERTPDPDDRRKVQVGLTTAGRELVDEAFADYLRALRDLFPEVDGDEARALADALRDLLLPLEAREPDA